METQSSPMRGVVNGLILGTCFWAIVIALFILPRSAHAIDFEIGTGVTQYAKPIEGFYYQDGYPYHLDLKSTPLRFGMSWEKNGYRLRASYDQLGKASTLCLAESDESYLGHARENAHLRKFVGYGDISGFSLTLGKETSFGPIRIYGEAGAFVFKQNWRVLIYDTDGNLKETIKHSDAYEVQPVVGVGAIVGTVDIGVRFYKLDGQNRDSTPFVSSNATVFTVGVMF